VSLSLRVACYAPNGARTGVLPAPRTVQGSMVFGDVGAFQVVYPATGPKASLLAGPAEVALEVSYDGGATWSEPNDARYLRTRRSGDDVDAPNAITYAGPSYAWVLSKSQVLPEGKLNAEGKRAFLSATVGTILTTLVAEAKTRGELPGLDVATFTAAKDSAGAPWGQVVTLYYEPGVDYLTILRNLQVQGLVDFTMAGRSLRVYRGDSVMAGPSGATLRKGRDLTEAPYTATLEGLATDVFLLGDGGLSFTRRNPEAPAPWGRWSAFISQGGVSDTGTMTTLTDAELATAARERVEHTYGLGFAQAKALPFRDYGLGRDVLVAAAGTLPVSLRVRSITLARDEHGTVSGNVVLNDLFLENEVRQARRITGITGGATSTGGTGGRPDTGTDTSVPKAPAGLVSSSVAYFDDAGRTLATVTLSWAPVGENTDGTAVTDLAGYEPFWRLATDTTWTSMGTVDGTTISRGGFQPGTGYDFTVRALDTSAHKSDLAPAITDTTGTDATKPEQPSRPGVAPYLGQLLLSYDGRNSAGGSAPTDFARAEFHLSLAGPTFTPTAATYVDATTVATGGATVATGLTYGATYWARIVVVDRSGNRSDPSEAVSGVPPKAKAGDVESITANQITAGAISAAITITGQLATSLDPLVARVTLNGQGIKQYDGSGVLRVDINPAGSTFSGLLRTAPTGARVEVQPVIGGGQLAFYSGMVSETKPGYIYTEVQGTGAGGDATITMMAPTKNGLTAASLTLASRDADTGADIILRYGNGSTYWYSDTGYGAHYYNNGGADFLVVRPANNETRGHGVSFGTDGDMYLDADNSLFLTATKNHGELNAPGWTIRATNGYDINLIGGLDHSNGRLLMTDEFGDRRLWSFTDSAGSGIASDVAYGRTYTSAANMILTASGTIGRSTSLAATKVAIDRAWAEQVDLAAVKALTPASFYDRGNAERYADLVDPATDGGPADAELPRPILGLIAEDVDALGLDVLLTHDEAGALAGVAYDRLGVALIPWLRDLDARLAGLETRAGV